MTTPRSPVPPAVDGPTNTWDEHDLTGQDVPHLLVIEDDPDFRRQLADYFDYLGWTVTLAETGEKGLAAFDAEGADVVLCDVMLPHLDGFQTIARLRDLDDGADVPVVFVSAVWQDPAHFEQRLLEVGAAEFLRKPLSIVELGRRLSVVAALPQETHGAATRSGQFRNTLVDQALAASHGALPAVGAARGIDVAKLFAAVFRQRRSGTLLLDDGQIKREVTFRDGYPVQASSTAPAEGLGSLLVTARLLPPQALPGILVQARTRDLPVHAILAQQGLVPEDRLVAVDAARVRGVLAACFADSVGHFEFLENDPTPLRLGLVDVHPVPLLADAVRTLPTRDLAEALASAGHRRIVRGREHARLHTELEVPAHLDWLMGSLAEGSVLQDVLDNAGEHGAEALALVWLLLELGIADAVDAGRAPMPGLRLVAGDRRPPSLVLRTEAPAPELDAASASLVGDYGSLLHSSYYDLLDVPRDADDAALDQAWRARAARWRPAAVDAAIPAAVRLKARELLARLADAHDVLTDRDRRRAYDVALGVTQPDEEDDSRTATEHLLAGRRALKAGEWSDALIAFRSLLRTQPRAVEALLGLAEALEKHPHSGDGGRAQATRLRERAAALSDRRG